MDFEFRVLAARPHIKQRNVIILLKSGRSIVFAAMRSSFFGGDDVFSSVGVAQASRVSFFCKYIFARRNHSKPFAIMRSARGHGV
jgi:hypothetical protein